MKKVPILVASFLLISLSFSCKSTPVFSQEEIAEYKRLALSLKDVDFTFGKKYKEDPSNIKMFKVEQDSFSVTGLPSESYFSLEDFPLINKKVRFVQKEKQAIFIQFSASISGWCSGIVYMIEDDPYLIRRAEVLNELDSDLYYFEGKS